MKPLKLLISKSTIFSALAIAVSGCFSDTEVNHATVIDSPTRLEPITLKMIDQTPDSELVWKVFERIASKVPENREKELKYILTLPKPQQTIYIIWILDGEVNNGGFNQYYYNSSGQFATLAPEALKLIGANQFAALTQEANELYKKEAKNITKEQDGTTEGFSKSYEDNPLEKLDDRYYVIKEPLMDLQIAYIRKNKEDFVQK